MAHAPHALVQHAPRDDEQDVAARRGGFRPLLYGVVTAVAFVTTVVVLALQAGSGAAMLTTVFVVLGAVVLCGVWGTAMAVRESEAHLSSALARELLDNAPSRSH